MAIIIPIKGGFIRELLCYTAYVDRAVPNGVGAVTVHCWV